MRENSLCISVGASDVRERAAEGMAVMKIYALFVYGFVELRGKTLRHSLMLLFL